MAVAAILWTCCVVWTSCVSIAGITVAATVLVLRPWDASMRSHHYAATAPYRVFWYNSWWLRLAELIASLKPAPMRLAELAASFTQSQVLYALVNLGVPDLLATHGPMTAQQLAAAVNDASEPPSPATLATVIKHRDVNAAWLERLLTAAAAMGMLRSTTRKSPISSAVGPTRSSSSSSSYSSSPSDPGANIILHHPAAAKLSDSSAGALLACSSTSDKVYGLNAISAALVSSSPCNMTAFVKLLEHDYAAMTHLSQGLLTGTVPFELLTGGQSLWQRLEQDTEHAEVFDMAMLQKRHIGGRALVVGYPWGHFDTIIDVAGGVGTFTADLLTAHPTLQGVVMDQQQQIQRGKQIWSERYPQLLPRVQLVAGNIFDSTTIPAPPEDSAAVAYVLYDILHNWPDAAAESILRCIRQAVERRKASSKSQRVMLLLLETTKSEEVLPCHLPFRCGSDIAMLTLFGDGCERNTQQFRALLAAAGWELKRLVPCNGIFMAIEATPSTHVPLYASKQ